MYRLTATFLLLFAMAGDCVPLALAVTAAPTHACCVRKAAVRHCHGSAALESPSAEISSAVCCGHDCCGAAATGQWAHPHPRIAAASAQEIEVHYNQFHDVLPIAELSPFQPARAPPKVELT
jgi:hypothetical protein